jgi:hypothetical protein
MERESGLRIRRGLQDSIALLASPAEAQIAWLKELDVAPLADELALEFDELTQLIPQLESAGVLDRGAVDAIAELSSAVEAIPALREAWTEAALATDVRWANIRRLAGLALVSLLISAPDEVNPLVRVG